MRTFRTTSVVIALSMVGTALVPGSAGARTPGVSRDTIRIGVHAPLTGASPVPSRSAQEGADVYWKWRRLRRDRINGRHVRVMLRNDNYNPSQAVAVCKEMVEQENVFMLSGLMNPEGKDQSQACARYAASVGVPYVSLGQMKTGVEGLPRYFALSMTWAAQSRLLADLLVERLRAKQRKNAIVWVDSPNFRDTHDAFEDAMRRKGAALDFDREIAVAGGQSEAQTVVEELKVRGIDNVMVLMTPVQFLQFLQAAGNRDYYPRWTGVGVTMTITDGVVTIGCRSERAIRGAKFLSPLPAFADHDDFDRTYERAMKRIHDRRGDMITWLGWATSRHLGKLLDNVGRRLTRKRFVERTERARKIRTGILPALNFKPRDHFGADAVHVLTAKCSDQRWHTTARFKRDF